jgi:rubredoxin
LSSPQHPVIRHCPLCGIAMQAKKSHEKVDKYDIFECLNCATVISEAQPSPPAGGTN